MVIWGCLTFSIYIILYIYISIYLWCTSIFPQNHHGNCVIALDPSGGFCGQIHLGVMANIRNWAQELPEKPGKPTWNSKKWWFVPCLKPTAKAPQNRPGPKRKLVFQPSIFRCELLVSGRVDVRCSPFPKYFQVPALSVPGVYLKGYIKSFQFVDVKGWCQKGMSQEVEA